MSEETKVGYGATDWNNDFGGKKRDDHVKTDYMKLKPGQNILRFISKPHEFNFHDVKVEGDPGFGKKVYCSMTDDCPVCILAKKELAPARKCGWYVGVIDRSMQLARTLEIGKLIYKKVGKLNKDEGWGNSQTYDVNVTKNPKPDSPNDYYDVLPRAPKPLSPEDLAWKEAFDFKELERKCLPPSVENVQKRLDKLLEGGKKIAPPVKDDRFASKETPKSNGGEVKPEDDTPQFLEK